MKYCTLSLEGVKRDCQKLSDKIKKSDFKPHTVIGIKTGGYPVGKHIAENLNVPFSSIRVARKGNGLKSKVSFIIKLIPNKIKNFLRALEVKSNIHGKNVEREISECENFKIEGENILIVDDSVDTGNSIIATRDFLINNFGENLNIKVCSLNYFDISKDIVKVDYYLYDNYIINYPWSKDSKEYTKFKELYKNEI